MGVKSKKTVGIRYNIRYYEIALEKSGLKSLQRLFDFLLENYVLGGIDCKSKNVQISPIEKIEMRPIDNKVFELGDAENKFKTETPNEIGLINKLKQKSQSELDAEKIAKYEQLMRDKERIESANARRLKIKPK